MNKVLLSGNISREIVVKKNIVGDDYVFSTIAVLANYKNREGKRPVDYINVQAIGKNAIYIGDYISKGDRVEIEGSWKHRAYKDKTTSAMKNYDYCLIERITRVLINENSEREVSNGSSIDAMKPGMCFSDDDIPW